MTHTDLNTSATPTANENLTPEQVVLNYADYLNQQDIPKIISLYHPSAEIIPDQLSSLKGRDAIISFYHDTFGAISIDGKLQIKSIDRYADCAIVRCEEPAKVTDVGTGQINPQYFRELFVLKKYGQQWLIQYYMFSKNDDQA